MIFSKKLIAMEEEEEGSLYTYLIELDPSAAQKISRNDTRRTIRALEVYLKSNTSISEMQRELTKPLPCEFIKIGLTRDRKELYGLIEKRVTMMIESGLVEEVRNILTMGPDRTPMQAIGYKEIALYLKNEISLDEAIALIKRGTRRYAKRQFTWFRKEEEIHWIDLTGLHESHEYFGQINEILRPLL